MTIPKLTPYTGQVANPDGSQTQAEFTQNMFDQLSYEAQLATQLDATIDGMNNAVDEVEANAVSAQNSADAAQAAANFEGEFVVGVTSAEKGKSYSYNGEVWLCLQNTTSTPSAVNAAWKLSVGEQYVTEAQEDLLPTGSSLFKGGDGITVKNGDTVPAGTTHLRVLIDGKTAIVSMSPIASGVVNSLTETSATIGLVGVEFYKQYQLNLKSIDDLKANPITARIYDGAEVIIENFYSDINCGGAIWVRDSSFDSPISAGTGPVHVSGNAVVYGPNGEAYKLKFESEVSLLKLGAREDTNLDDVYKLSEDICRNNSRAKKIILLGHYNHTHPLVVPAGVKLDYVNYRWSSTTKITNNTSGLPTLTGSYGGDLVMDVDAAIILDHGYGGGVDNFTIKCFAPVSVAHGIYHGFTRTTNIAKNDGQIGELDQSDGGKRQFFNGVTAQQGFFHHYGRLQMFCKDTAWNYEFNQAGTGCNVITCDQSWNYLTTKIALKFEGSTNVHLNTTYLEDTASGILRAFGATGVHFGVLSVDRHVCNNVREAWFIRNSQITIDNKTINGIEVESGQLATWIALQSSGGIKSSLSVLGMTARTANTNITDLKTMVKDRDNAYYLGVPYPLVGDSENIGGDSLSLWSATSDTGKATTQQNRSILNSYESQAKNQRSLVANSFRCIADKDYSSVFGSTFVRPGANYETCGGFGGSSGIFDTDTLSSNRKWSLDAANGNIYGTGTVAGGHTFSDFAEYFENAEIGIIPLGTLVDLEGDKVTPANGDEFIGVVSGTAGFILNEARISWQGRYLVGEFGEPIWEEVEDDLGNIITVRKENPDYSPEREILGVDEEGNDMFGEVIYSPRSERQDEWSCVGLTGQVYVSVDESVNTGDYIKAANGIGFKSETKTNCRVMKKTSVNIAKCLIK